jgi:hypothetical protein
MTQKNQSPLDAEDLVRDILALSNQSAEPASISRHNHVNPTNEEMMGEIDELNARIDVIEDAVLQLQSELARLNRGQG